MIAQNLTMCRSIGGVEYLNRSNEHVEKDRTGNMDSSSLENLKAPIVNQFTDLLGEEILVITETAQLNLLGQTFRPIFVGPVVEVEGGHITLFPVTIKILNAPFYKFPTPLSIPLEKIAHFTPDFDSDIRFPLV